jgi:hypothetical protein
MPAHSATRYGTTRESLSVQPDNLLVDGAATLHAPRLIDSPQYWIDALVKQYEPNVGASAPQTSSSNDRSSIGPHCREHVRRFVWRVVG